MSEQPWETHDPLCPNRRPTIAFPNSACSGCRAVVAARAEGYARGLIEGDHGGRREGYRSGYAAGKDAVMTASYAQAVAEGQREAREAVARKQLHPEDRDETWSSLTHVAVIDSALAAIDALRERSGE